jgi:hypothetical protein
MPRLGVGKRKVANEMKIATRLRVELVQKEFVPYFWIGTQ